MDTIKLFVINLLCRVKSEKGQTLVEYALIIVLIALAAIVAMKYLGGTVNNTYSNAASTLAKP
ncbi:Flp family type IVb pilin [Oryzomonas japonica]|uniref:Flp family type IVb pilin n=1 Tax=Oryzomonas japonica TaxID=2603858 RepID=A0A7J4ZSW9_9BACT|nr:Flp family type IVb pilin [Oryzomonas japonica]KAB0666540.1 Flp family type IVb pilin [Oryzomonas japonica]